ncbi:MAG: membrane lipoprotein lipid attachment site-containing protein [Elusimicrobia bacterium]|nr:membrane lipoprotein lipid attachment site-containing protein [Elusimicrobiota bacterium]
MKKFIYLLIFVFVLAGCGKKKGKKVAPPQPRTKRKITKQKEEKVKKIEKYVYQGYKNRNPFFAIGAGAPVSQTQETQKFSSDLGELTLTGIMIDISGEKYALLGNSQGSTFVLKNGWLYDFEGNRIPGYTGTVFEDRIILIHGSQMKELKLPETEETLELK